MHGTAKLPHKCIGFTIIWNTHVILNDHNILSCQSFFLNHCKFSKIILIEKFYDKLKKATNIG